LDAAGEVISADTLPTTKTGLSGLFEKMPACRVALEVGTHSPWVYRHLAGFGHEVLVANPRKVRLISHNNDKDDPLDAERLARLARFDPKLLHPIQHRGATGQRDLAMIRARATLVEARTKLINAARGLVKAMGERLPHCESEKLTIERCTDLSEEARSVVEPLLKSIAAMTEQISGYDQEIASMEARYPETELLKQVHGVGALIAVTFVLTLEDPDRFRRSRDVGPYLGFRPRQRNSGASRPELGISKEGDRLLRALLVQAAHCMLRRGAPESDLRRWALAKLTTPGQGLKKRVVTAVARKLAVLLHRLWSTGEVYNPAYNRPAAVAA
jgi:transposase